MTENSVVTILPTKNKQSSLTIDEQKIVDILLSRFVLSSSEISNLVVLEKIRF